LCAGDGDYEPIKYINILIYTKHDAAGAAAAAGNCINDV
jgi:hypothetical protein